MNWLYLSLLYTIFPVPLVKSATLRNPTVKVQIYQILIRHNFYRQFHHSKPLKLDKELNNESLKLAENMAYIDRLSFARGINVFTRKLAPNETLGAEGFNPVDFWYQEARFYRDEGTKELARNFTQLVWSSSKKLGVGIAVSTSNTLYIVCKYDPPGNIDNAYKYNVLECNDGNGSKCDSILESVQFPYFRHAKNNSHPFHHRIKNNTRVVEDATSNIDTIEENYSQPRLANHFGAEIDWWSIFDNVMETLASELHLLLLGSHDHSIKKRDLVHSDTGNFEESINSELKSLSLMDDSDTDSLLHEKKDDALFGSAKVRQCCCEEEPDPPEEPCTTEPPHKKCGCQRITTLEIISRKVDMVLVFTVFNNIFMIIFGVAVTLGVVIQWCSGPGMNQRRRR